MKFIFAIIFSAPLLAVLSSGLGCIIEEENGGCDCRCDYFARKLDIQAEAQMNLQAIFTGEVSYHGEMNTYSHTFADIAWRPEGERRYAYFIEQETIQPNITVPYPLLPGIVLEVTQTTFNAAAVGNIDCDDTLDVWTINQDNQLINLVDDLVK